MKLPKEETVIATNGHKDKKKLSHLVGSFPNTKKGGRNTPHYIKKETEF